jgi:DNA-binding XRE family transcriptional regulator
MKRVVQPVSHGQCWGRCRGDPVRRPGQPGRDCDQFATNGGGGGLGKGRSSGGQDDDVLGTHIRAQRQLADLSLRQLAAMTNVPNAYLSQIERGLHQPSVKVLRSIASALNLSGKIAHSSSLKRD